VGVLGRGGVPVGNRGQVYLPPGALCVRPCPSPPKGGRGVSPSALLNKDRTPQPLYRAAFVAAAIYVSSVYVCNDGGLVCTHSNDVVDSGPVSPGISNNSRDFQ